MQHAQGIIHSNRHLLTLHPSSPSMGWTSMFAEQGPAPSAVACLFGSVAQSALEEAPSLPFIQMCSAFAN